MVMLGRAHAPMHLYGYAHTLVCVSNALQLRDPPALLIESCREGLAHWTQTTMSQMHSHLYHPVAPGASSSNISVRVDRGCNEEL